MKNLVWVRLVTIFLVLFGRVSNIAIVANANAVYPAVFAFGDSIFDTGNNNNLATASKCNFPPYGRDFYGGAATGRFGNGKVLSDVISKPSHSQALIIHSHFMLLYNYLDRKEC